jgi:hypothetical protein
MKGFYYQHWIQAIIIIKEQGLQVVKDQILKYMWSTTTCKSRMRVGSRREVAYTATTRPILMMWIDCSLIEAITAFSHFDIILIIVNAQIFKIY